MRETSGRTISNKVFRDAMEHRAREYEEQQAAEDNHVRKANLESLIKGLRPKRFSEGPLCFGLQHICVQERMRTLVKVKLQQIQNSS
jgi:hypothetical protein